MRQRPGRAGVFQNFATRSRLRNGFDDEGAVGAGSGQLAQKTAVPDPEAGLAGREGDWPSSVDFRPFIGMRPDGEDAPFPAVRADTIDQLKSTLNQPSWPDRQTVGSTRKRPFGYAHRAADADDLEMHPCRRHQAFAMPPRTRRNLIGLDVIPREIPILGVWQGGCRDDADDRASKDV